MSAFQDEATRYFCDVCGQEVGEGGFLSADGSGASVCADCGYESGMPDGSWLETRRCTVCGRLMTEGYTGDDDVYVCEDCWSAYVGEFGLKPNDHEDDPEWDGGYWDEEAADGSWHDTGIYWTSWEV